MLCFVCFCESDETLPIFGEEGIECNISEIVEKHLNLKPQLENETCEICGGCWGKISEFHAYYQHVLNVHNTAQLKTLKCNPKVLVEEENTIDGIKEEFLDEIPTDTMLHQLGTEDIFTKNPFLALETETKEQQGNVKSKKRVKRKSLNCTKAAKTSKRKKSTIAEDHSSEEEICDDIKYEDEDVNVSERYENSIKRMAETKRRKGLILLEENEDLIKKHIQMLCQLCTHSCDGFPNLIKHFKIEHPDIKPHIKCCDRKLDCPSDILQHAYYHEDPDYFKCSDCDRRFINSSGLRDHYLQNHEPEENLPYGCDQCPRRFSRKNLLEHHKSKHVPKTERSHFCEICNPARAFANEYILQLHIKNRHTKATNICHVCAKEIRDKQAFEKHVRLHFEASGPRLKCPRDGCDSWLKDADNLKQHLRRFHDARQYECPQCGRVCKNKHSLTCHLKNTHTTKTYICEQCQKNFKSQQSLKEHMAGRHTGEPLYNCPFCTRTFNSKANMYSHKKKAHPKEWETWNQSRMGTT